MRQNEADLITAVHELCDGTPSEETIVLLKSLDRPLLENINVTCLYGANFDVNYINHEKLEDMAGEELVFKAKDEGMFIKKRRHGTIINVTTIHQIPWQQQKRSDGGFTV